MQEKILIGFLSNNTSLVQMLENQLSAAESRQEHLPLFTLSPLDEIAAHRLEGDSLDLLLVDLNNLPPGAVQQLQRVTAISPQTMQLGMISKPEDAPPEVETLDHLLTVEQVNTPTLATLLANLTENGKKIYRMEIGRASCRERVCVGV